LFISISQQLIFQHSKGILYWMKNELIYIISSVDILAHYNTQFITTILSNFT
jgi:hypothetical protein